MQTAVRAPERVACLVLCGTPGVPGASIYDFAGVGHSSYFEDPSTFNQIVGDFITKHLA